MRTPNSGLTAIVFDMSIAQTRVCSICGATLLETGMFPVREMMNGTRELFHYSRCPDCECVQLMDPPQDIGSYYVDYYGRSRINIYGWTHRLHLIKFQVALGQSKGIVGKLYNYLIEDPAPLSVKDIDHSSSVLDVGCASGQFLVLMMDSGFSNVRGCDPFIDDPIQYDNGVSIAKRTLDDEPGTFDLVMAHHVMEHVPNQAEFAAQLYSKVRDNGMVLVRVPTSSSWAFDKYGSDWFQLDAPRHFYLHSRQSIVRVLEGAGFVNVRIHDDSTIRQILSSRLYSADIASNEHMRRYYANLPRMLVSGELARLKKKVRRLNKDGLGDQICIFAEKKA